VATWVYFGARGWRIAGIAWNVFGLLDFLNGFVLASFVPYNFAYPGVMIPAFLAPLSVDLHGLSIRQLMRVMGREEPAGGGAGHLRTILRFGGKLELRQ
jgi:hypothetical protein